MNTTDVDKIANALLYEGYMLYPYRRSVKNRKRWTFGCIHPSAPPMQTECLLEADDAAGCRSRFAFCNWSIATLLGCAIGPVATTTRQIGNRCRSSNATA